MHKGTNGYRAYDTTSNNKNSFWLVEDTCLSFAYFDGGVLTNFADVNANVTVLGTRIRSAENDQYGLDVTATTASTLATAFETMPHGSKSVIHALQLLMTREVSLGLLFSMKAWAMLDNLFVRPTRRLRLCRAIPARR